MNFDKYSVFTHAALMIIPMKRISVFGRAALIAYARAYSYALLRSNDL